MTLGLRGREEAAFDPRSVPGLQAWFDALRPQGFGQPSPTDGTLIHWADLSGQGRDMTGSAAFRTGNPVNLFPMETIPGGAAMSAANWSDVIQTGTPCVPTIVTDGGVAGGQAVEFAFTVTNAGTSWDYIFCSTTASDLRSKGLNLGDPVTMSFYAKVPVGTGGGNQLFGVKTGSALKPILSADGTIPYPTLETTRAWTRCSISGTVANLPDGSQGIYITSPHPSSRSATYTLRLAGFQFEKASAPTAFLAPLPAGPLTQGPACVALDSTGIALGGSTIDFSNGISVYAVASFSPNGVQYPGAVAVGHSGCELQMQRSVATSTCYWRVDTTSSGPGFNMAIFPTGNHGWDGNPHVTGVMHDYVTAIGNVDGKDGGALSIPAVTNPLVGQTTSLQSGATSARYSAVLLYDRKHDDATRRRVINWLGARYGIALTRP